MSCRLTIKGYLLFGKEFMQLCYVSVCCNSPGASNITHTKKNKKKKTGVAGFIKMTVKHQKTSGQIRTENMSLK